MGCSKHDIAPDPKLTVTQSLQQDIVDITIEVKIINQTRHRIIHGISYVNKEDNESTKMPPNKKYKHAQLQQVSAT